MREDRSELVDKIYKHFKSGGECKYDEEKHCRMLIQVMMNPNKGTVSSYCVDAMICPKTFHNWVARYPLFENLYHFSKMLAREQWEDEGRALRDADYPMGTINYSFEYWKMMGWSRFGISKVSKIKIEVTDKPSPSELYYQIIKQAKEGDYTAGEFKQLMEAVNVGVNIHQLSELQNQIDELKSALLVMEQNTGVQNPFTDKGIA